MYSVSIDKKDVPKKTKRANIGFGDVVSKTVHNFMASDDECIELIDDTGIWANSNNFRRSFQSYLDDHNIKKVNVTIRGDRVFLLKIIDEEK